MPFTLFGDTAKPSTGLTFTTWLSLGLAVFMVLSGGLALVGWGVDVPVLVAPLPGWRPMSPISAILTIILGLAFWQRIRGRRRLAFVGAGIGLLLTVPGLLAVGRTPPLWDNPLTSALLYATASVGVLSGLLHRRPDLEKMILSLTGIGLIALAGTVAFATTLGMLSVDDAGSMTGSSLQSVIATGMLGFAFLFLVWWSGFREFEPPRWLPVAAGLISLVTVVMFWNSLRTREQSQREAGAMQASIAEQRFLQGELASLTMILIRTAEWLELSPEPVLQERLFLSLLRDLPGLAAVFRLGPGGTPVAQAPVPASAEAITAEWRRLAPRDSVASDSLVFRPLDANQERFLVFVPVCHEYCNGALAAVIQTSALFAPARAQTMGLYRFTISGPIGPLGAAPGTSVEAPLASPRAFGVGTLRWTVAVHHVQSAFRTRDLPAAVLFLGLAVTLLVPLTLQLGLSAWLGAQERERARLSFALDRATDGVWEVHLPSGHTVRSPALWNNLGYLPDSVPSAQSEWFELIHPDDRPHVDLAMSRHLAGQNESYEVEYRVKAADDRWHTLVERGRVVDRTVGGEPSRLIGITADVTEARAAERAREDGERRFRAVFNSSFQFQILLDSSCRVLEANPVTLQLAGLTADAVLGKEAWETLWWAGQPEGQQRLREACQDAADGRAHSWEQEIRVPGRPPTILELSVRGIEATGGGPTHLLLEGRDVSERRRVEASLREVDTLTTMGRIAARVAHEINNPLAGIQNAFLLIRDAVPPDHPHHRYVGAIEREVERISLVTRQLYETYRPESDLGNPASVALVVTDAAAFLEQVNRSREVTIVTDLERVPGTVPVPAAVLRQIVYNLAQNAIDASPQGGTVEISASATPDTLTLTVRDEGPGVPEELRDQIFEPFFSTKGNSMKTSGMGLGLALLRQTVMASGGEISVGYSPSGGGEFVVTLPLDSSTWRTRNV